MRCDIIAQGIINASKDLNLQVPIVVRLQVIIDCRKLLAILFHEFSFIFCFLHRELTRRKGMN